MIGPMKPSGSFPVFRDERGTLVPVELDQVPFAVRRVFAVSGVEGGSTRGNHRSACLELVVLVSGECRLEIGPGPDALTTTDLTVPGATAEVPAGSFVRYVLRDDRSVILVLADDVFDPDRERLG